MASNETAVVKTSSIFSVSTSPSIGATKDPIKRMVWTTKDVLDPIQRVMPSAF